MKTTIDCLACFLRQTLHTLRLTDVDDEAAERAVRRVAALLPGMDFSLSPPENSVLVYQVIAEETGVRDPFAAAKEEDNRRALALAEAAKHRVESADDPLRAAVLFAIGGNVMDYGSQQEFDLDASLERALSLPLAIDDYGRFKHEVSAARNILYLADNCGEIAFDRLLIEQLPGEVTCAVKERPIINDALMADADACGLPAVCRVISNGTGCPGTPLRSCSRQFMEAYGAADLVISKGQGNFETLSTRKDNIFYLLTVKCPVVGRHIMDTDPAGRRVGMGERVLLSGRGG